jgi:hypothetical protein
MAVINLSDLLSALESSLAQAQRSAHDLTKQFVEFYTSDPIMRTFKVPNYEFELIQLDIPINIISLMEIKEDNLKTQQYFIVMAKKQVVLKTSESLLYNYFRDALGFTTDRVADLISDLKANEIPILVTSDKGKVGQIEKNLFKLGIQFESISREVKSGNKEILVDTESHLSDKSTLLHVEIKPQPMRLIKDVDASGEKFIVEPLN